MFKIIRLSLVKNILTTKFMRNTGWLLFEQIFRMVLTLIVISLMARYLGTHDFGLINYGLAYIMIFTTMSNLGIDSIIVNEIIKNKGKTGNIIGTTIFLRFFSSLISILLIYIIVIYLNADEMILRVIIIIQSISLLFIIFDSIQYWFQSNLQSKYVVISKSIAFTIVSLWRLVLIFTEKSIHFFAFATVIEAFIISLFIILFYVRFKGPKLSFSLQTAKQLLSQGSAYFIAGLLIMVYTQIDKIMLGKIVDSTTVGIYSAALTIASLWMFIPNAIINSARPIIMGLNNENKNVYIIKNKQLYCAIIWLGIVASIFITLFSEPLILLIYGEQFVEAIDVLVILIWSRIFALIGSIKAISLTVESLGRFQVYFVGIAAVINVGVNFLLIPRYGAIGAAISTLFAEVISALIAVLFFKETRPLFKLIIEACLFKGVRD